MAIANVYSFGASEEITGRALRDFARREEVTIATKVWGVMRPGSNGGGLSAPRPCTPGRRRSRSPGCCRRTR